MKRTYLKSMAGLLLVAAGLPFASCMDDSYDMSKDLDLTVGLGSEGLQLKLGNTERIMLADILEVDENLQTDAENRYYLIEEGSTRVDFSVSTVSTQIDNTVLRPTYEVVNFEKLVEQFPMEVDRVPVAAGKTVENDEPVHANTDFMFDVKNIKPDLKWIKRITPVAGTKVRLVLSLEQNGMDLQIKDVKNLVITLPDFLRITNPTKGTVNGNKYTLNDQVGVNTATLDLGEAEVESITLDGTVGKVESGTLHVAEDIAMDGNINFIAASNFEARAGSYANLKLSIQTGSNKGDYSELSIQEVTGRFAPAIEPNIEDIDVSSDLPDFLRDDEVRVTASNPTIRFNAHTAEVPVGLNLAAELTGVKDGETIAAVTLPGTGSAEMAPSMENVIYFYQDAAAGPYDPDGVVAGSNTYVVNNISDIIERIPDVIKVNLAGGKVSVKDEDYTVTLGRNYSADMDYRILVPFTFKAGLKIVYNDSITGMNEDITDYQAEGMQITAIVENTIPMKLYVNGTAIDTRGNVIPGIHITPAEVQPSTGNKNGAEYVVDETPVTLDVTLDNPADLGRLDRINFTVKAGAEAQSGALCSDQYIRVKDIRMKLTGKIIGNFN